ncbi:MAG: hypothetical protein GKR95_21925 [Gammaproteobacteria bacterium]|nr:hypothetical protein [Gammaproteobacteria bacterium]
MYPQICQWVFSFSNHVAPWILWHHLVRYLAGNERSGLVDSGGLWDNPIIKYWEAKRSPDSDSGMQNYGTVVLDTFETRIANHRPTKPTNISALCHAWKSFYHQFPLPAGKV